MQRCHALQHGREGGTGTADVVGDEHPPARDGRSQGTSLVHGDPDVSAGRQVDVIAEIVPGAQRDRRHAEVAGDQFREGNPAAGDPDDDVRGQGRPGEHARSLLEHRPA